MSPDSSQPTVTVPAELKDKYPELVELILGSESMNDEERQYWINILPVMTPEQIENLKQILGNEKNQLKAIDAKYSKEMEKLGKGKSVEEMAKMRREKRASRKSSEGVSEDEERQKEQEILKAIAEIEG
jgi:hypothetical protein